MEPSKVVLNYLPKCFQFRVNKMGIIYRCYFFYLPIRKLRQMKKHLYTLNLNVANVIGITFSPKIVFADFKKTTHLALLKVWPFID